MEKFGRDATLTPVVLKSAKNTLFVRGSSSCHTDQTVVFKGAMTSVFLKMTLRMLGIRYYTIGAGPLDNALTYFANSGCRVHITV